jgi:hypothetical protein
MSEPTVFSFRTGKQIDPEKIKPKDAGEIAVDGVSLALAEDILERVKAGKLTHLGIVGLCENMPISAIISKEDLTIAQVALVNVAVDALKGQVQAMIRDFTYAKNVDVDLDGDAP